MNPIIANAVVALVVLLALRVYLLRRARVRVLHVVERQGSRIVVRETATHRELVFEGRDWELIHTRVRRGKPRRSGWPYTDGFQLALVLVSNAKRVLFVGGGGGVGPMQFARARPELAIDVVEVDAEVLRIAREFFAFETGPLLRAFVEDGRVFLERSTDRYDVVVLDAYDDDAIPTALASREFFELLRSRLEVGGVLCANLVGSSAGPDSTALRRVVRTMQDVFGPESCLLFAIPGAGENRASMRKDTKRNHLAFASNGPFVTSLAELIHGSPQVDTPDTPLASTATGAPPLDVRVDDVDVIVDAGR
jgi:predicted membrane-bound spermidine synthase